MKKLISPLPVGRMPVFKDDLLIMQDEVYDVITSSLYEIDNGEPLILGGGFTSGIGGGNVTIGAALMYLDGDVYEFAGYTGPYPAYIHADTSVIDTKVYFDGSTQNVYETKQLTVSGSAPGGGQYILYNPTTDRYKTEVGNSAFQAQVDTINAAWTDFSIVNGDGNVAAYTDAAGTLVTATSTYSGSARYKIIGKTAIIEYQLSVGIIGGTNVAAIRIKNLPFTAKSNQYGTYLLGNNNANLSLEGAQPYVMVAASNEIILGANTLASNTGINGAVPGNAFFNWDYHNTGYLDKFFAATAAVIGGGMTIGMRGVITLEIE